MPENEPGPDPIGEDARLRSLEERLRAANRAENERTGANAPADDGGYRLGNRVLAELLGGMIGGAFIGWAIDWLTGWSPWGLLVMLFLGIIVAFRNIIRISKRPK